MLEDCNAICTKTNSVSSLTKILELEIHQSGSVNIMQLVCVYYDMQVIRRICSLCSCELS